MYLLGSAVGAGAGSTGNRLLVSEGPGKQLVMRNSKYHLEYKCPTQNLFGVLKRAKVAGQ